MSLWVLDVGGSQGDTFLQSWDEGGMKIRKEGNPKKPNCDIECSYCVKMKPTN